MSDQEIIDIHGNIGILTGEVSRCTTKIEAMTDAVSELSGEFKGYRSEHGKLHDRENKAIHARLNALGAPRTARSVDMNAIAKVAAGIGIALAMGLSAWASGTSASEEDVKAAVRTGSAAIIEAAADVAAERAKAVIETEGVATGKEIQGLTDILRALMEPRPVTAPPAEVTP